MISDSMLDIELLVWFPIERFEILVEGDSGGVICFIGELDGKDSFVALQL